MKRLRRNIAFQSNDIPELLQYDDDSGNDFDPDDAELDEIVCEMQDIFEDEDSDALDPVQVVPPKRHRRQFQGQLVQPVRVLVNDPNHPNDDESVHSELVDRSSNKDDMDPLHPMHIKTEFDTEISVLIENTQEMDVVMALHPAPIKAEMDSESPDLLVESSHSSYLLDPLQPQLIKTEVNSVNSLVEESLKSKITERLEPVSFKEEADDEAVKDEPGNYFLTTELELTEQSMKANDSGTNRSEKFDEGNEWTFEMKKKPPGHPSYKNQYGVRTIVHKDSPPYECLRQFFTPYIWSLVQTETNRYASQMVEKISRQGQLKDLTLLSRWKPVTLEELKKFFSIIIHMIVVQKHSFDNYWATTSILYTPFASKIMSRDRFRAIFTCLHLNDNSNYVPHESENYDPFFKVRPFLDQLCQLSQACYQPNKNLTINEDTCGFRSSENFRGIIKDSAIKSRMKMYTVTDAETGYALKMMPCVDGSKTIEDIVMELMEPYLGKWHTVFMDRHLTNPDIFDLLWKHNTCAVGPLTESRHDLPQEWRNHPLEENEMTFCHRGNLTACKWKEKQDVLFLSTKHAASWTEVEVKVKGDSIKKMKPDCVLEYNVNKNAVEMSDQYVSYCSLRRKSMKWWKKIFFHLMARAIVNSYIIYNNSKPGAKKKDFAKFLAECGEAMARDGGFSEEEQRPGPKPEVCLSTRLNGRHFLEKIPASEKKEVRARVCKVCADTTKKQTGKRGRKETTYYCPDCNVALCVNSCFKKYHTQLDYTE